MAEKHHFKLTSESPYLGSWDLVDKTSGKYGTIILTIDKGTQKMTEGLPRNKIENIIYFKEKGYKPMIVNTTNGMILKALAGSPIVEDWANTKIEIYVLENIEAFGALHDGLRIRNKIIKNKIKITKSHPKFAEIKEKYDSGTNIETIKKFYDIDENILKD